METVILIYIEKTRYMIFEKQQQTLINKELLTTLLNLQTSYHHLFFWEKVGIG